MAPKPKRTDLKVIHIFLVPISLLILCMSIVIIVIAANTSDAVESIRSLLPFPTANYTPEDSKGLIACGIVGVTAACFVIMSILNGRQMHEGHAMNDNDADKERINSTRKFDIGALSASLISALTALVVAVFVSVTVSSSQLNIAASVLVSSFDATNTKRLVSAEA